MPVGIGDVPSVDDSLVAFGLILGDGIDDLFAVRILIHILKGSGPDIAVFLAVRQLRIVRRFLIVCRRCIRLQLQSFAGVHSVGEQMDGDAFRTHLENIVLVVPCLGDGDGGLLRFMGIGKVKDIPVLRSCRRIGIHRALFHGIDDRNAHFTLHVLVKIVKAVLPVAVLVGVYGHVPNRLAVRQQGNDNAVRTESVAVVVVIPADLTGNRDLIDLMDIDQIVAVAGNSLVLFSRGFIRIILPDSILYLRFIGFIEFRRLKIKAPSILLRNSRSADPAAVSQ